MDLNIELETAYVNKLDMKSFEGMLASTSQCYKFYWLEAIMNLLKEKDVMTFAEIIDQMLWNAHYSVIQYHLHLGPVINGSQDNYIEHALHILNLHNELESPVMTKEGFISHLREMENEIGDDKKGLELNVPYRLLSSFLGLQGEKCKLWNNNRHLIAYIDALGEREHIPYIIEDHGRSGKSIHVDKYWRNVMIDNYVVIQSWIRMKKVEYLQARNPSVPGIIYKLERENPDSRKLSNVKELWMLYSVASSKPIIDIYSESELSKEDFSLDHFIPWSYIANDELWDLTPMNKNDNSSKGRKLPPWNTYFKRFAHNQYCLYRQIMDVPKVKDQFEKCRKDNLNSIWASERLYVPDNTESEFQDILEHNMKPLYDDAEMQGYSIW